MDELRDDWIADLEQLLRQRIGLNPQAVSRNHIRDAVRQCLAADEDVDSYLNRVRFRDDEFQDLVERLIVPESWFFRDVQPFRCLEHFWNAHRHTSQSWRMLSAPCGTGEEPYSMVMTLLSAGVAAARIHLDAIDISQRVLEKAAKGHYDENSFRERDETMQGFRDRFFRKADQRFVIENEARAPVQFRRANLVAADFLQGEEPYHVIFCRNLLIYLDASARRLALSNLRRLLRDDGLLYVGHVEAASVPTRLFRRYSTSFPFAFQPAHSGSEEQDIESPIVARAAAPVLAASVARAVAAPPTAAKPELDPGAELDKARLNADRGRLAEAEAQCLELLSRFPARADVYCLLGVVHRAQGDVGEAEKCFQKALYLDPRHHETLVHAALLADQRGDEQNARNYRRRADVARPGE